MYEKLEVILDKIEALDDRIKSNVAELRKLLGQNREKAIGKSYNYPKTPSRN